MMDLNTFDETLSAFRVAARKGYLSSFSKPAAIGWKINTDVLADDLIYASMLLRDAYEAAVADVARVFAEDNRVYSERLAQYAAANPGKSLTDEFFKSLPIQARPLSPAVMKFAVAMKGFMFFARAYQDGLYRLGLLTLGMEVGAGSSMTSIFNNDGYITTHQLAKLLRKEVPEYLDWFKQMRDLRNAIKDGIGYGHSSGWSSARGAVVSIQVRLRNTNDWPELSLPDAATALTISCRVLRSLIAAGVQKGHLAERPE